MTDAQADYFIEKIKERTEKGVSKEEFIRDLQRAGILDENGEHTPPYKNLPLAMALSLGRYKPTDQSQGITT